jgi:hypothetical protein
MADLLLQVRKAAKNILATGIRATGSIGLQELSGAVSGFRCELPLQRVRFIGKIAWNRVVMSTIIHLKIKTGQQHPNPGFLSGHYLDRSVFKTPDHVQRQGAGFLGSAAYTVVYEHF